MPDIPVALQMYTVRDACEADFAGTLARVAEIGYAGVELAGTYGLAADELADRLGDLGLKAVAGHIRIDRITDATAEVVELHQAIGADWVVVPSLPEELRASADGFRRAADRLGEAAATLAEHDLKLAYHNHAFEFERFDGEYGYDLMMERESAAAVLAELDVYWVKFGGAEPADYVRKYGGRCELLHLKDMTADDEPTFAEVGHGVIDFEPIFKAARDVKTRWYIVEQDRCDRPSLESAAMSFRSLQDWGVA